MIQFILIPLVGLYLLILYVYGLQILFTWELPKGGLTYLILSFSIAGMLAVLLALVQVLQWQALNLLSNS